MEDEERQKKLEAGKAKVRFHDLKEFPDLFITELFCPGPSISCTISFGARHLLKVLFSICRPINS